MPMKYYSNFQILILVKQTQKGVSHTCDARKEPKKYMLRRQLVHVAYWENYPHML